MFKLSPSALNLMKDCPRCFWLNKHKVWKRPNSIFPTLPSGMDRILKEHFDRFMEKGELPPELKENGAVDYKLFDNKDLLKVWRNNFEGIRFEEGDNVLFGAVDNILKKGEKLIVLDYKTRGYPLKEDTADHYQNQLDIYNFLLRKNNYETENYAYLLFYVPDSVTETGEVVFDTKLVKMSVDVANGESLFKDALELLNAESPQDCCVWCEKV